MTLRTGIALTALGLLLVGCGGQKSVAGTYKLVKGPNMVEAMAANMPKDAGPMAEVAKKQIQAMVDAMALTLVVAPDGTFTVSGNVGKDISTKGTWKMEKEKLVLTATHEDGKAKEKTDSTTWIVEGNKLRMAERQPGQPFDFVLERQ